ncbi:RlpA-like double-psi beta-barrel domain-containing protein [Treponema sp. TIM-1]|uniref:RlpA-like double-psi beta-barrel domain-containing protein n=1 Tax=Treponema sp. TIM-1 TaxID=2898417 RepID=UPI00397F2E5D
MMPTRVPQKISSGFATYNIDEPGLRAAHAELEFDTRVRVTNLNNNQAVIVTITERIPFDPNWIIHIGRMAGDNIGMSKTDVTPVKIEVLGRPKYPRYQSKVSPPEEIPGIIEFTDPVEPPL